MSTSRALVPVVTVPVRRQDRWWVAEAAADGVWTRGKTLAEVRQHAQGALALAREVDPSLIAARVVVECPEIEALTEARQREREALTAAVVRLRSQHVPWPDTALAVQVSQRKAREVWDAATAT